MTDSAVLGIPTPRIQTKPANGVSRGYEVAEFAKAIDMPLLDWQRYVLDEALKIDNERYVHKTNCFIVSRQNGKTHLLRMRILAGLFLWDERLQIATAQNRDVALETFRHVVDLIESYDWLRKKVRAVTRSNGREEVYLKNGCRYKIIAPTAGAARGLSADTVYLDEARMQKTTDGFSALAYTMQARPNPQLWVTSNAGDIHSVILNSIRDRAMHKIENDTDDDLMYMEWSAHQDRRLGDIEGWREANPALGHTIQLETLKARMSDPPEVIQTEMLCQWVTTMNSAFPQGSWNSCAQPTLELKNDRPTWLGLEISPERDYWALCGTQVLDDKSIAVGLMEHVQTETPIDDLQIASRVADWAKKYNAESVVANRFTGDSVVAKLKQAGIRAEVIQGAKYYQACDESLSAISGLRVRHSSQPELTNAVNSCTKRTNDSGAWYIMRRKASTAAIAMVLAISKATEYGQRSDTDIAIA